MMLSSGQPRGRRPESDEVVVRVDGHRLAPPVGSVVGIARARHAGCAPLALQGIAVGNCEVRGGCRRARSWSAFTNKWISACPKRTQPSVGLHGSAWSVQTSGSILLIPPLPGPGWRRATAGRTPTGDPQGRARRRNALPRAGPPAGTGSKQTHAGLTCSARRRRAPGR